jgi:predicted dehydrogenase
MDGMDRRQGLTGERNPMITHHGSRVSRRSFLRGTSALAAAAGFPSIVPSAVLGGDGKTPPSGKLRVALIGCGNRSGYAVQYSRHEKSQIVAVCDPIRSRREAAKQKYGGCADFDDFRAVLADPGVDAVHIATADHWHVPISLLAAKAGKAMYTEKPLGICIEQDLKARAIADTHGVAFQYGAQQRSIQHVRMGIELVLNGHIGDVKAVHVWAPRGESGGSATPELPVPEGYDYEMWLGPAPRKPFCHDRCLVQSNRNGIFHIYDYAIGFIAGWGAHPMDMLQWWADNAGRPAIPVRYEGTGTVPTEGLFDTLTHWNVTATYADGLPLRFMDNQTAAALDPKPHPGIEGGHGTLFVGTEGWVRVSRDGWKAFPEALLQKAKDPGPKRLEVSRDQIGNFIESALAKRRPIDDLHSAVRSDIACHLSDIAIRTGRPITWDPVKETIVGDTDAAKRMSRPMRDPWTLDKILKA